MEKTIKIILDYFLSQESGIVSKVPAPEVSSSKGLRLRGGLLSKIKLQNKKQNKYFIY